MTTKPIFWSHTVLNSFETCPRRHHLTRVTKTVTEPQTEQLKWGNEVHKALELRQKGLAPLPAKLQHFEPVLNLLMRKHGKKVIEGRFAIDASFRPVGWKDPTTWCRAVVDTGVVGVRSAFIGDWKTGNRKPDADQLKLTAAITFAHYPYLEQVHTAFIWLKEKKVDYQMFTHEQVGGIWNDFLPRVKRLEAAHQTNTWHPKPSGLCGKWCPVTKQHCEFGR